METFKFLFRNTSRNALIMYTVAGSVFILSIVASIVYVSRPGDDRESVVEEAERNEILSEITRNNPKTSIQDSFSNIVNQVPDQINSDQGLIDQIQTERINNGSPSNNSPIPTPQVDSNGVVSNIIPAELAAPDLNVYNYRYTKTDVTKGARANECTSVGGYGYGGWGYSIYNFPSNPGDKYTIEDYAYFDQNRSYYRNETRLDDGELVSYNLGRYGSQENEYLEFMDGEFAVRQIFNVYENFSNDYRLNPQSYGVTSYANEVPTSYGEDITLYDVYFGPDATITDIFEEDGTEFYEIISQYNIDCISDNNYLGEYSYITVYKVNASNFEIVENSRYYNEISDENLVRRSSTINVREKLTLAEIQNEFTFDLTDEITEVNYREYEFDADERLNQLTEYYTQLDNEIIFPVGFNPDYVSIFGRDVPNAVENSRYYLERDFYSSSNFGEKRYNDIITSHNSNPKVGMRLGKVSDGYDYIHIFMNDSIGIEERIDNLTKNNIFAVSTIEEFNELVNFNNEQTEVTGIYRIDDYRPIDSFTVLGASYPGSYSDSNVPSSFAPDSLPESYENLFPGITSAYRANVSIRYDLLTELDGYLFQVTDRNYGDNKTIIFNLDYETLSETRLIEIISNDFARYNF